MAVLEKRPFGLTATGNLQLREIEFLERHMKSDLLKHFKDKDGKMMWRVRSEDDLPTLSKIRLIYSQNSPLKRLGNSLFQLKVGPIMHPMIFWKNTLLWCAYIFGTAIGAIYTSEVATKIRVLRKYCRRTSSTFGISYCRRRGLTKSPSETFVAFCSKTFRSNG